LPLSRCRLYSSLTERRIIPAAEELLTPTETSIVSRAPLKEVYKIARERLPSHMVVRRSGKIFFKRTAAVCVRIDHELPKDVPVKVRRAVYLKVDRDPRAQLVEHKAGLLRYVVDASAADEAVTAELATYRRAMELIIEDPEVQGGAATFKGTRILVHTVADLLKAGARADELKADFPNLTDAMFDAAAAYARTHPKRGRPKAPPWRGTEPARVRRYPRSAA
jgi:uncharacterized protein (DUF433 family)